MPILNHRALCVRPRRRPVLPPVQCAPWCWRGDGHPNEFAVEDQGCLSDGPAVDTGWAELGAYANHRRPAGTDWVTVFVERTGDDRGLSGASDLTAAQAREFAAQLLAAADLIDPPVVSTPSRDCLDCGVVFAWDESPDDDRCAFCADVFAWFHGEDVS